jgi:regulator of protease activity HflC (stomatin/prohibitin superfamily)
MQALGLGLLVALIIIVWFFFNTVKILKQYERGVIFTLGKVALEGGAKGPGMILLVPGIQKMVRVSLRTVTMDVPSQDVITKDNVTVKVNAVVYFRVIDPRKAIVEVEDFYYATSLISQTTLRSILGQNMFDDLLSNRESINAELQKVIDQQTEPWGVKVTTVEVRNVDLPAEMQRAIAIQAQAERERRAKIIHAEGELQASAKLGEAAAVISKNPVALQLRYLQTLTEIGTEKNTTIVFPLPIDLMTAFQKLLEKKDSPS